MFRGRKSQKPTDELYASFKYNFPEVGPGTTTSSAATSQSTTILCNDPGASAMDLRNFSDQGHGKDNDSNLQGQDDNWKFTPSVLDPNTFNFNSFGHQQQPGYYTPTSLGATNPLYHNQAGDLHTPGMAFALGTPLSMPTSDGHLHAPSSLDVHGFQQHIYQPHSYHHPPAFPPPPQSYAPSSFVHQDSGYGARDASNEVSPGNRRSSDLQLASHRASAAAGETQAASSLSMEKFRYRVILNAPTAMISHPDEIPVTYLNKGQAYTISIVDSIPFVPPLGQVKYRTVVRISFEDEQQRSKPSACWQLWKEGRGLAEAHQRGGKLQAVEYVNPNQGRDEETKRPRVELEKNSFDSFSVTWLPNQAASVAECSVAVRFNFLSTDFSHSKGVKGIPVRLCAKTEMISSGTPDSPLGPISEVCFCKVKLFRDHGAERKLSNDIAHIKKTIEKLKQQVSQFESGGKDTGKRKRSNSIGKSGSNRPSKVQKHKRSWSVSSQSSTGRPSAEDDLHTKLENMQDMFSSIKPISNLYLKGYEEDDPDLHPVSLLGQQPELKKIDSSSRKISWDQRPSISESTPTESCISPALSSHSMPAQLQSHERVAFQKPTPFDPTRQLPSDWHEFTHLPDPDFHTTSALTEPTFGHDVLKVQKNQVEHEFPEWFDALGVDHTYQPPPDRQVKPIACFYVLVKMAGDAQNNDCYRAVYLMQRDVSDLVKSIAAKCGVDAKRVFRTLRINGKGLKILVDNEVVRELPEGQDMTVEFSKVDSGTTMKLEGDAETNQALNVPETSALEMRLCY